MEQREIERQIRNTLKIIGISPGWKGYRMWVTAIIYKIDNREITMGELYNCVAKKHKATASKAERALRYSLNNSKARNYFGLDVNYKLNNSTFSELLIEEIIDLLNI